MKKLLIYIALVCISLGTFYVLFSNRFWPFSTGTNITAFLDTTFEMSLEEVQRTLNKSGIRLIDRNKLAELTPGVEKKLPRDLLAEDFFSENKLNKIEYWYTPSISMFDSEVVAEFEFTKNKLMHVTVWLFPFSEKNSQLIVDRIVNKLKQKYSFIKKEYGTQWNIVGEKPNITPLTYDLEFHGKSSCAFFWVNLMNIENPRLTISLSMKNDEKCTGQYLIDVKKREAIAF